MFLLQYRMLWIQVTPISFFDHFIRRFALMMGLHSEFLRKCESIVLVMISADLLISLPFVASKVIKRFILHAKKTAFSVEHDFIMATYFADRVIVYEGQPYIDCTVNMPQSLLTGMDLFLSQLNITFRRDPINFRARINKLDSTKDRE